MCPFKQYTDPITQAAPQAASCWRNFEARPWLARKAMMQSILPCKNLLFQAVFRISIQLNLDPAKNLIPEPDLSYF